MSFVSRKTSKRRWSKTWELNLIPSSDLKKIPLFPFCQIIFFGCFSCCLHCFCSQHVLQGAKVSSFWCKSSALPLTSGCSVGSKTPVTPKIHGYFLGSFFWGGPEKGWETGFCLVLGWCFRMCWNYQRHHSGMLQIEWLKSDVMVFKQNPRHTNHSTRKRKWMTSATNNGDIQSTEISWRFLSRVSKTFGPKSTHSRK